MAKPASIEHARRKRRLKVGTRRALFFIGMIAAIVGIVIGVNAMWRSVFVEKIGRSIASLGAGDGYPVISEGKTIRDIYNFGPDIAVVTDTSVQVYNKSAKHLLDANHHLSNPVAELSDVRILLYEPSGKNISVYNCKKKLFDRNLPNPITAAAISNSGTYAAATQGDRDASVVYVYNKASDLLFTWYSDERVSDIAISPDGRYVAASTLTTDNGVIVTKVYFFSTFSKKQTSCVEFKEEMAVQLAFMNNSDMLLVTDKAASLISVKGKVKSAYSYGGKTLGGAALENKKAPVLMLGSYDNFRETRFVVLDDKLAEKATVALSADVKDFKGGERISVLTEHGANEYSYAGELLSSVKFPSGRKLVSKNNCVYVCSANGIEKHALQKIDASSASDTKE